MSTHAIKLEITPDMVRAYPSWMGPSYPRTPAPPFTAEMLEQADQAARTLLNAQPGQMQRRREGNTYIYTLGAKVTEIVTM